MRKLRTVEDLDAAISNETVWRKKELSQLVKRINSSDEAAKRANLRAALLLIYAHWEGWTKNVAKLYLRYINSQGYSFDQLSPPFLASALQAKIREIAETKRPGPYLEFADFLSSGMGNSAKFPEDLIRTESNLNSELFLDIVVQLGLEVHDIYRNRSAQIDQKLLGRRNAIAHGQRDEVEGIEELVELRDSIITILERFTDDVRNAASRSIHTT